MTDEPSVLSNAREIAQVGVLSEYRQPGTNDPPVVL
jgi:hypothetical protein